MGRLLIVSNRVQAARLEDGSGNQGGLSVALSAALRESGGIWFGWSGDIAEHFSGGMHFEKENGITTVTVDLEARDVEEYYSGYANCTLWPLFHYRLDLARYDRMFANGYERVNERFAQTLVPLIEEGDLVWVNDYHLIPLGDQIRRLGRSNRLGFFLHIPWPPMRLLLSLPSHRQLVELLLAYDVVGFQAEDWLESFHDYLRVQLGLEKDEKNQIAWNGRTIQLVVCPVGLDSEDFKTIVRSGAAKAAYHSMVQSRADRSMIIGVDRLDHSKGVKERFCAFERLLATYPRLHEQLFLLQISPIARDDLGHYREIRSELEALSGRINGAYASPHWVPIRYVNQSYDRATLAGMYRAARVGLVTPLRDGMNIVAKEYVAAQDPDNPGVLVLSRFAGAAAQLDEALLVNPYSSEEVSEACLQALSMSKSERLRRWRLLNDVIEAQDTSWWWRTFIGFLDDAPESPLVRS
ncbi:MULTISPECIES: alpha,alpha-trehalose-phosphate synthase (UDP-forming) [Sphingobium]|uniref:Alpha,alpha-trehalose-phosphate synthase n=1 Tax=Sphingobium chungbukense TaxID=56193 RepID=A0A0M3AHF3_9SPHN|nr:MULTISPECIES: trehalose-6-phosphate synthase [Sphingobium]KKW89517.1 alpha,alpha-trehalose-phosphate synthase [Sphingobium chungbukense]KMS58941.1 alpha,alpha-trehalose-phosphate synthase [Sphingobium baderi LL03]